MLKRLHPMLNAEGAIGAESTSVEGTEIAAVQTQEASETTEDVTKQESFAKRLKESTDKAITEERAKWEKESTSKAQQARDAYIAEQGYTWQDKPITTEAEYKQAVADSNLMEQYKAKDLPDDVIKELVESKKFRDKYEADQKTTAQKAKVESDFQEFMEAYPEIKADDIPKSVWDEVNKGRSLVDSFARYENLSLKQKLAEATKQKQIEQLNEENKAVSTGSVVGNGSAIVTNFTREQVESMSKEDMKKNYGAVVQSMKTWKK